MLDVEEIREELRNLEERLNIDSEIIEYIVRDIAFAERIFIYESERHPSSYLKETLENVEGDESRRNVILVSNENPIPSDCSEYDCFLVISELGEEDSLIQMVETARENETYVYAFCSNFQSKLSLISDSFVYIPDNPDFEENAELFFTTTANRLRYFVELAEYEMDGPPKLSILAPLVQPERVRKGEYSCHIKRRASPKEKREFVKDLIIMIIFGLILLALFYGIIFIIQHFFGIPIWDNLITNGTMM